MNRLSYALAGMVSFCALTNQAVETARTTIFCYSLRFQRGLEPDGNYYLDVTSVPGSVNGELASDFFNSDHSHSTYLSLIDELLGETLSGQLALDVPPGDDLNKDGFPDFFQISQGVTNWVSTGAYHLDFYGNGSSTATWNRKAGSKDGSCALTLRLMPLKPVTFSFAFEIMEYSGPLTYAPTGTNVTGAVKLLRTCGAENVLTGAVNFLKTPANRFNELTLQAGSWTNESQQVLSYVSHLLTREETWPTNYYGYLEFDDDNNQATFSPYALWMLSIDDLNDTDHDGIPDFSDDPASGTRPRKPHLELLQSGTNLVITLHADVGYVHEIQQLADLSSTNWQTVSSFMLTNDPQRVSIPLPRGTFNYWRVRAR
jgi:hypothetical protein